MVNFNFALRVFWITGVIFLFNACNASSTSDQSISDFDKLCKIYTENVGIYNAHNIPLAKIIELVKRMESELPNIMNDYKHISNAPRNERYQLFKQVAEENTKKQWDCPSMKLYFSGT